MVLEIETPKYPNREIGNGYATMYPFLFSAGIKPQHVCVRECTLHGVDSVSEDLVSVLYEGEVFTGVPVLYHTDFGTRSRSLIDQEIDSDADPQIVNPEQFMQRSSRLFLFKEGAQITECNPLYDEELGYGDAGPTRIIALVHTHPDTGVITVLGIVGIIEASLGSWVSYADIRNYAFRSYTPCILLKEAAGTSVRSFSLFDLTTGAAMRVPTSAFTAYTDAIGLNVYDYEHVWGGGIELENTGVEIDYNYGAGGTDPRNIGWPSGSRSETQPLWYNWDSSSTASVGDDYPSTDGGFCNTPPFDTDRTGCAGYIAEGRECMWECTGHTINTHTCSTPVQYTEYFEAVGLCSTDEPPVYFYEAEPYCVGSALRVHFTEYQHVFTGASLYTINGPAWYSNMGGKTIITWITRDREDVMDTEVIRERDSESGSVDYTITMRINDSSVTFHQDENTIPAAPCCGDGVVIAVDATNNYMFSFTMLVIVSDANDMYAASVEHDYPPATGIITDNLASLVFDRCRTFLTENTGETAAIKAALVFIPYDIRERLIEETP